MLRVSDSRIASLAPWFAPERPGPVIHPHIRHSGAGRCLIDRWPDPRLIVAETGGGNIALRGDPSALTDLSLDGLAGFVDAPDAWEPALRSVDAGLGRWQRVIAVLPAGATVGPPDPWVRRVTAVDAAAIGMLADDIGWIGETWGGASGLAACGMAWAAFDGGAATSVAVPFFVGDHYEDIGVVTAVEHRRRGLSRACAAAVITDVRRRGHVPTWTTSPDNAASLAVADRLGFRPDRDDVLWALRADIPGGS